MARIGSSGAELQSVTGGVEILSGAPTIDTSVFRSGAASYLTNSSGEAWAYMFSASNLTQELYARVYVRCTDLPSAEARLFGFLATGGQSQVSIRMNTDGTLELWNDEDLAQIGLASSALDLNQWYRLEIKVDSTTLSATTAEARLDGVSFASGTANLSLGFGRVTVVTGATSFIVYSDDMAVNNTSGSFQNSWPGEGEIIHLRPNANGDNSDWTGTAGSNYENIDEITPDDATTIISSNTLDQITDVNLDATPAEVAADDTINVVQVGVRFNTNDATGVDPTFVLRIKASAGGTVEESSTITASSTTFGTNAPADPRIYALTLYDLPGASTTAWTKAELDTAQIGVRETLTETHAVQVTTMWLLVEHTPYIPPPPSGDVTRGNLLLLGVG